jgi:rhodanese-related sulfurtransferase
MNHSTLRIALGALVAISVHTYLPAQADAQLGALFGRKEAVPEIKVDQLRKLRLDDPDKVQDSDYVLVDVRTEEESSVSLIPGAITKAEFERNPSRYDGRTVIAYCTSGYRSEKYTRELIEKGRKAMNFKGSILEWCRANLPVVAPDGSPTDRVHTYSKRNRIPAKYEAVW